MMNFQYRCRISILISPSPFLRTRNISFYLESSNLARGKTSENELILISQSSISIDIADMSLSEVISSRSSSRERTRKLSEARVRSYEGTRVTSAVLRKRDDFDEETLAPLHQPIGLASGNARNASIQRAIDRDRFSTVPPEMCPRSGRKMARFIVDREENGGQ